jgi:hypothetical protein|uniref:Uncharacterized protein n=1 Tax=Zea mays TaxID=4577 RepID=A0A804NJ20_MAIZE
MDDDSKQASKLDHVLVAVGGHADGESDGDAALAGDGGDGAHVDALDAVGEALEAAARRLAVRAGPRRAVEALDAAAARRGERAGPPRRVRDARRQRRPHLPAGDRRRSGRSQQRRRHQHGHHRLRRLPAVQHSRHRRPQLARDRSKSSFVSVDDCAAAAAEEWPGFGGFK